MPLVTGCIPPRIGRGHGRGCRCYPDDTGEPSTEGGTAYHATTDQYPLTKALPGLAGIGLHNWGVECTAHTRHTQSSRVEFRARSMKRAPGFGQS